MNQNLKDTIEKNLEFQSIIKPLIEDETVQQMKNYRQHFETSCFEHCYVASYYCYKICKKLHIDYISAARAAMLHDLFLYDWRLKNTHTQGLHAFKHPQIAYENACKLFELNKKEKDIILKHMWPVTLAFPRYLESFILTLVDKFCALQESFESISQDFSFKKALHYSYILLFVIILKRK